MYRNIGKKIKVLAKVVSWACLIMGVIIWLVLLNNGDPIYEPGFGRIGTTLYTLDDIWGWFALFMGVLAFFSSWLVYGFGQLVEDTHDLYNDVRALRNQSNKTTAAVEDDELPEL